MNFTKEDFTEEELKLLRVIFKTAYTWLDYAISYEFDRNTLYYLLEKLGIYDLVRD